MTLQEIRSGLSARREYKEEQASSQYRQKKERWHRLHMNGIMTRVGLHCAPSAHKTLGTYPDGTIRFSFGFWNTTEEVDSAVEAMGELTEEIGDGV